MIARLIPEITSPLAVDYSNMQLGTGKLAKAAGVAKNIAKIGGKALGIAAVPLTIYEMNEMRKQGKTTPEILASPFFIWSSCRGSRFIKNDSCRKTSC